MFVVAPLFLILVLAWAERGAPGRGSRRSPQPPPSALLLLAIPFERFVTTSAVSDTLMLLPWWAILDHGWTARIGLLAFLGGVAFAAAFLLVPARYALVLPAIVLVYWVVALKPIWFGPYPYGVRQAGAGALFQGIRGAPRDWIDRAVPAGKEVAVLYTGAADRFTVNMNEFFNRRVGPGLLHDRPDSRWHQRAARHRRSRRRGPHRRRSRAHPVATSSRTGPSTRTRFPWRAIVRSG